MQSGGELAFSPFNDGHGLYAGSRYVSPNYLACIALTSDGGATWQHESTSLGNGAVAVAFDPADSNRFYVGGGAGSSSPLLLISTDRGQSWTESDDGLSGTVKDLAVGAGSSPTLYCATTSGVFRSTDRGQSWATAGLNESITALVADTLDGEVLYAGGSTVFRSTDGGASWSPYNTGLNGGTIMTLALGGQSGRKLFANTSSGGVFRDEPDVAVGGEPDRCSRPQDRGVLSVDPNPVRGYARIEYTISRPGPVSLQVCDVSGRVVRVLESCSRGANTARLHQVTWNGRDDTGRAIPGGVYFCRLRASDQTEVRKLILTE